MADKFTIEEIRRIYKDIPSFFEELDKIDNALCEFYELMRDEMFDKAAEDCSGWDDEEYKEFFMKEIAAHIKKGNFVGVANFAMMLHFIIEREVENE